MENTKSSGGIKGLFKSIGTQKLIAVIALVAIYLFFAIASKDFRSWSTLVSIFDMSYYIGFMAIGVTFVIITGGIDLSIGTVCICSGLIGGQLYKMGVPIALCLIITILIGIVFGLLNGLMVSIMKLPAFIATLGTMMVTRGLGSIVTGTQSITYPLRTDPDGWYSSLFRIDVKTANGVRPSPIGIILLIVAAIIMAVILNKTRPGRYILALGSNKEATRLSGVNVVKWETLAYMISGLFAGIAGIAYASTYFTLMPGTGNGFELDAIAGVVIGGTSLSGGVGSVAGTMIGVFIMSVLKTGLPFVGLQPHYQLFITGLVLIVAVYADVRNRKTSR